jgi:pyruvate, orthophosphate dikinase
MSAAQRIRELVLAARAAGTPEARRAAVEAAAPTDVESVLHGSVASGANPLLVTGLGVSPGGASGPVYFTSEAALDAYDRGEDPVLCCVETTPADEPGMRVAVALVTARGGTASHAAVVARALGIPAVCGADRLHFGEDSVAVDGLVVHEGDVITVDGATGAVHVGAGDSEAADVPAELDDLLSWADGVCAGRLVVRANADTAADAMKARDFGAAGIGLCRTEHMFLGLRLPVVQRLILAEDAAVEADALAELRAVQREDFVGVLEAMDGLPVTVRLLDPPLHEFLPPLAELEVADALGQLDDDGRRRLAAARHWHERNPMIGTRGVRLAVIRGDLYRVQVRALADAVRDRLAVGGDPRVEIMIPLVVAAAELAWARARVEEELDAADLGDHRPLVGTMIETPRAALLAGEIAAVADFFSLGTNDMTQLVFGFSRDDVESRVLPAYLREGLLPANPFEHLDEAAVAPLLARVVADGRRTRPGLKVGVCGEHGGDPASIRLLAAAGVDTVSCSPYRVPVARLAAAQAVLALG